MTPTLQQKHDPFAAMRIPEYRNLMMGRFLFIMGLRMMGTLVGWWVYELTNEPFAIGLIGLSEVIPAVSLSLYAGHIIDISEKRKLLLRGVSLYFACALLLLGLSTNYTASQISNHWIAFSIYVIIFFTGIFRAFTGPSFGTMVASIVPKNIFCPEVEVNIYGNKVAFLTYAENMSLIVESKAIADCMRQAYELSWVGAKAKEVK